MCSPRDSLRGKELFSVLQMVDITPTIFVTLLCGVLFKNAPAFRLSCVRNSTVVIERILYLFVNGNKFE